MLTNVHSYVLTIFPMRVVQQRGNRTLLLHPLPCAYLGPKSLECCATKLIHKPFGFRPLKVYSRTTSPCHYVPLLFPILMQVAVMRVMHDVQRGTTIAKVQKCINKKSLAVCWSSLPYGIYKSLS